MGIGPERSIAISIVHYPGVLLTLVFTAFLGGMLALYVHLPQAIWRLMLTIHRHSRRFAACLQRVGARILTTLQRRPRRMLRPPSRQASHFAFSPHLWRPRPRIVVLIADPLARRARAAQLREALTDLLRAHRFPPTARLTVQVASDARFHGTAYVAYLVQNRATGVTHIRLATSSPDGAAIGVDVQHTRLADLFPYLDDNRAITFVGLPVADPSSPVVTCPPPSGSGAATQQRIALSGGTFAAPPDSAIPRSPAPSDSLVESETHIPYGDHDAPVS